MDREKKNPAYPDAINGGIRNQPRLFLANEARLSECKLGHGDRFRSAADSGLRDPEDNRHDKRERNEDEEAYVRAKQRELSKHLRAACEKNELSNPEEWDTALTSNAWLSYDVALTPSHLVNSVQAR